MDPLQPVRQNGRVNPACYKPLNKTDEQSNTIQYKVAKFSFKTLNIGDGVKVKLVGNNPIHLDITGDATVNAVLDANGSHGNNGLPY